MTHIDDCVISKHAQMRWDERRPGVDIRACMMGASRKHYHPAATRAVASYKGTNDNVYYLVTKRGEVFVMAYEGTKQILVTVLIPEKVVNVPQFSDFEGMSENELKYAIHQTELRQRDLRTILKQLGASRLELEGRLSIVTKHRNRLTKNQKKKQTSKETSTS